SPAAAPQDNVDSSAGQLWLSAWHGQHTIRLLVSKEDRALYQYLVVGASAMEPRLHKETARRRTEGGKGKRQKLQQPPAGSENSNSTQPAESNGDDYLLSSSTE